MIKIHMFAEIVIFYIVLYFFISRLLLFIKELINDSFSDDRGSVALIVMTIMLIAGMVSFIVQDAAREQKIRPIQVAVQIREVDPNATGE